MHPRVKAAAVSGLETALTSFGYERAELALARSEVVDWARTRAQATRARTSVLGGLAVVVTGRGRAELRPVDRPLAGAGEITVEVLVSAVSPGTERAQWLRLPNAQPDFPYAPGYSGAGRVIAAGPGAGLDVGRTVAVARLPHASVATVPASWATPIPDDVDLAEAALVYMAIISGYGVQRAELQPGEPLGVVGAGPIGLLAQRLASLRQPGEVTVMATGRRREALALRGGADRFLTAQDEVDGVGAVKVIEATGDPHGLATAVTATAPGGTVVLLGSPRGATPSAILADAQRKRLRLVGAHVSALATEAKRLEHDPFQALAGGFLEALGNGALAAGDLVGEAVDPREAQLTYRRLARGEIEGAHFDWRRVPQAERTRPRSLAAPPALPRSGARLTARDVAPPAAEGTLRFALVGCGDVGLHNARALAAARNAELVISHDPVPALAQVVADEVGGEVAATLEGALDPARVDAAFLCVPHDLHAPLVQEAAAAGLHIVVEKPLANDLAGARHAVDAAAEAGVALSVCFPYRYEPAMQMARDLVHGGALGELRGATVVFHADKPESYWVGGFSGRAQSGWRSNLARSGGGVVIMNLTHYLDFIQYVTGARPSRVQAVLRRSPGSEVEDGVAMTVEFEGGALASISGSASTRGAPASRFELWGDDGTLRLEPEPSIYSERAVGGAPAGRWCSLPEDPDFDARVPFVEEFAAAVLEGRAPEVSAADGLAVQEWVEAAYRSAEHGSAQTVGKALPA